MAKSKLRLVSPTTVNRTVTPRRRPNAELRTREHLTDREVGRLIEAAKQNRYELGGQHLAIFRLKLTRRSHLFGMMSAALYLRCGE